MEEKSDEKQKRTASADPLKTYLDSTQEFFDMWLNSYQSTFGKLTQVPAFGPIREKQEKIMKGFPIYVNLYSTWVDSNINFQTIFTEAMKKTYEKMIIETKGKITVEKYKDFYKIWLETYSETLKEFMKSGHYTTDMGKLMTHFVDFQRYNKEMIEENILKPGNLPTKTEIDEINKELYSLKKILKDLDKKSNDISKTIGEHEKKIEKNLPDLEYLYDSINKNIETKLSKLDGKNNDISKNIEELYKKIDDQKTYIKLELDKKITQLDLDKKIAEVAKKTKTEIQLDTDKKITDATKKTKTEIQSDLDKKISEISKKIDEQPQNRS